MIYWPKNVLMGTLSVQMDKEEQITDMENYKIKTHKNLLSQLLSPGVGRVKKPDTISPLLRAQKHLTIKYSTVTIKCQYSTCF